VAYARSAVRSEHDLFEGVSSCFKKRTTELCASGTRRHDVDWLQKIYVRASSEMKVPTAVGTQRPK
jgi:hypothetical protein